MNKRLFAMGIAGLLALSIVGCGGESVPNDEPAGDEAVAAAEVEPASTQVVSYGGASIEVPGTWEVADAADGKYVYPEYGGTVYLSATEVGPSQQSPDESYAEYVAGLTRSGEFAVADDVEKGAIGEAVAYRRGFSVKVDGMSLTGGLETILSGTKLYSVMFAIPDDVYDQHAGDIDAVLDSIELDSPEAPALAVGQAAGDDDVASERVESDVTEDVATVTEQEPAGQDANVVINAENNEEFAHLLTVDGPGVPEVGEFAEAYEGCLIEFDGVVTAWAPHGSYDTRFDFLINVGDDPETATRGPNFKFEDINYSGFHWVGEGPEEVLVGTRVHVVARVDRYESAPEIFYLVPVETSVR